MKEQPPESLPGRALERGFSLVELLVAMAVVTTFMVAGFALITNFLGESGEQAALAKRGLDARLGLTLVRRDLRSAGFGIATKDLGGAVAGTGSTVTIRSTAVHSRSSLAGQHGVIQPNGNVGNGMGGVIGANVSGVAISPDRDFLQAGQRGSLTVGAGNLFFVGRGGGSNSYFYERQYLLGGNSSECAGNTPDLRYSDTWGGVAGVVNCVADLRVRYGFETTSGSVQFQTDPASPPATAVDSIPDLLKVGLLMQAGQDYKRNASPATLSYTDPDFSGVTVNLSSVQRRYHWEPLEWTVPLENMQ